MAHRERSDEWLRLLQEAGAILTDGHFVLASGLHSPTYIDKRALFANPALVDLMCSEITQHFSDIGITYDTVVGPEKGAIVLTYASARWACWESNDTKIIFNVTAEKEGDTFRIPPTLEKYVLGKRVLVVEDIVTTGGSVRQVLDAVRAAGGQVVGVGAVCNRGDVTAQMIGESHFFCLFDLPTETYTAAEWPARLSHIPVNPDFGRGREFLAAGNHG